MGPTIFELLSDGNRVISNGNTKTKQPLRHCRGRFCNKSRKCENSPNLPLGSLEVFIYEESSPKFQIYNEIKANGVLTRENQNANNVSAEKA